MSNVCLPRELVEQVIDLFYAVQPRYDDPESEGQTWEEIYKYRRELKSALSQHPSPDCHELTEDEICEIADAVPVDEISCHADTWHIRFGRAIEQRIKGTINE